MTSVAGIELDELLEALNAELVRLEAPHYEPCVIGGTALGVLGLVSRPTKDVDVVALGTPIADRLHLAKAEPLPEPLSRAIAAVGRQLSVSSDWLNTGPADLMDQGLPDGFVDRLESRTYGERLTVHYAGRFDQVCLKTYAAADVAGRHLTDLVALRPTANEMVVALAWARRQDPSEGFREMLAGLADYLEVPDALDGV
jgi:hypothetical protein